MVRYVTGNVLIDKNELPDLIVRVVQKQHNDGIIRFKEIIFGKRPEEIKIEYKNIEFNASEINNIY